MFFRFISYKIKAATLLEVLVAFTLIMLVICTGTMIFVNVTGSSYTGEKINSILLLNEVSYETYKSKSFFDEEITKDNITIVKKVEKYTNNPSLLLMSLSAMTADKKILFERKEIVLHESE